MKRICVLGATGSIGRQTLDIVKNHPELFKIVSLSTHQNIELLTKQIEEFNPKVVAVTDENTAVALKSSIDKRISILAGSKSLIELVNSEDVDVVVNGLVGSVGLDSTLAAIRARKTLALANKESMVVGGELVRQELREYKTSIIPVDSEHNAIFQCLLGEDPENLKRIILTGSGGPFRGRKLNDLANVTTEEALAHPRWNMGKKISIDSATLMNKGLETIEAHFLFGVGYDQIEVVIHPQSIIHSMVEFSDGSIIAQLAAADMKLPIQYALCHPDRRPNKLARLDLASIGKLNFFKPDLEKFPCLQYACKAANIGGTMPAVMSAADEIAVQSFLDQEIRFSQISQVIAAVMKKHKTIASPDLAAIINAAGWAREEARKYVNNIG